MAKSVAIVPTKALNLILRLFDDADQTVRVKVADSQVASRWGNITQFKGFDLITPNEREARFAMADQDSGVRWDGTGARSATRCTVA